MAKQDDFAKFQVRVPQDLRDALEEAAADSGRSINAELVKRLDDSFRPIDRMVIELRGTTKDATVIGKLVQAIVPMHRYGVERIELRFVDEKVLDRLGIGVSDQTPLPPELD